MVMHILDFIFVHAASEVEGEDEGSNQYKILTRTLKIVSFFCYYLVIFLTLTRFYCHLFFSFFQIRLSLKISV
jgi:hypothetical protein